MDPNYNTQEPIIHGACLGMGLIGLASENLEIYEILKNILNTT